MIIPYPVQVSTSASGYYPLVYTSGSLQGYQRYTRDSSSSILLKEVMTIISILLTGVPLRVYYRNFSVFPLRDNSVFPLRGIFMFILWYPFGGGGEVTPPPTHSLALKGKLQDPRGSSWSYNRVADFKIEIVAIYL